MKIVVAMDSFKGSLSSIEASKCVAEGIGRELLCDIVKIPMADGGEGTVDAMVAACGGFFVEMRAADPLGRPIPVRYGVVGGDTAVIEMAAASGLTLLGTEERNPLVTTTYGTGEMISDALSRGYTKIITGIGGSATNDGGTGMAQALGFKLLDGDGREIGFGGGELHRLRRIDITHVHPALERADIRIACDVRNPLCGKNGAAETFGPQKGAAGEDIRSLDEGLSHLAEIVRNDLGMDILNTPGGGAAGGLGAGLAAFCKGRLLPGIEILAEAAGLRRQITDADLVVTGEGKTDTQTAFGKLPFGIGAISKEAGIPCIILSGAVEGDLSHLYQNGITAAFSCVSTVMSLEDAMSSARYALVRAAQNMIRLYLAQKRGI